MPFGAWILWPLMVIMSAPSVLAENGTFRNPCTASVCSRAMLFSTLQHPGDGGNVIDRAGLIVDHHERDEDRVRPQRRAHALERDGAGAVRLQARDLVALFSQKVQRLAHGVVLHGGADDVFPAAAHVPRAGDERPVVALGAAGCEIHLVRLAAERFRRSGCAPYPRRPWPRGRACRSCSGCQSTPSSYVLPPPLPPGRHGSLRHCPDKP